jgi:hypothetical protein
MKIYQEYDAFMINHRTLPKGCVGNVPAGLELSGQDEKYRPVFLIRQEVTAASSRAKLCGIFSLDQEITSTRIDMKYEI